jgi:putative oxygen-independent coproporphyrinogen III oxidase
MGASFPKPLPSGASVDALTGMSAAKRGLYVHFPWCLKKCPYCDFAVTVAKAIPEGRYTAALLAELTLRQKAQPQWAEAPLDSVYLGGGTPSLYAPAQVQALLHGVKARLGISQGAEVTLEANPEVADIRRLAGYRKAGVNRLSLGVQSFDGRVLKALGRVHAPKDGTRAVRAARRAGFDNVSLDIIFGVMGESLQTAVADAKAAADLGVEHVSAYVLTVEREALAEETVFARRLRQNRLALPPEGLVADMVEAVADVLSASGLLRYEVSSYAKPGRHSRHNALYWTGGEYLALGPGATGFGRTPSGGVRSSAHRSPARWFSDIEAGLLPEATREVLGPAELFSERLMLGLRFTSGLDVEGLAQQSGQPSRKKQLQALVAQGLGEDGKDGRFRLTRRGLLLHSEACARLL